MSDHGRYRKVFIRLWRHPGFLSLNEGERNLVLYLLTGPQTNRCGLYVLSIATAAEDLGTVSETITKRLGRVCETFGWLFDKRSRVLFIPSWFRFNPPENANVMKGSLKDLNEIPPCGLLDAFAQNVETVPETLLETFVEGLRQRLPKGMPNQEQYQKQKLEQEQKPTPWRAAPNGGHVAIALEAFKLTNPNQPIEALVDAFFFVARSKAGDEHITRAEAITAINRALTERRASA